MAEKVHLVSLGCPKNLVDSEIMLGRLSEEGIEFASDVGEAECIIVNTCAFIEPATMESIETILKLAHLKVHGRCKRLIVTGCLPQRYGNEIVSTLPEVDIFLGTGAFDQIVSAVNGRLEGTCYIPRPDQAEIELSGVPRICTTPSHFAYLKIAEGCSNRCTYCIIPRLRGSYRSRPIRDVVEEASKLAGMGVRELILVAQDTTAYGSDLNGRYTLADLLMELARIPELIWIRVLYGHPDRITDELLESFISQDKICRYFDIPVQHASRSILRRMGRSYGPNRIKDLFIRIRERVPDAVLRTTFLVGFPGETEEDFKQLLDMIEEVRFDHLGAFAYSHASDLPSGSLNDSVPEAVKQDRLDRIMSCQSVLSKERNQRYVGEVLKVVVEGYAEETELLLQGRAWFQAPEIDGVVYINKGNANVGDWVDVLITEAFEYDLLGEIL